MVVFSHADIVGFIFAILRNIYLLRFLTPSEYNEGFLFGLLKT